MRAVINIIIITIAIVISTESCQIAATKNNPSEFLINVSLRETGSPSSLTLFMETPNMQCALDFENLDLVCVK